MTRTIRNTIIILNIIIMLWLALSYFEILCKSLNNPVYSNFNLIVMTFEHFDKVLYGGIF